MTRASVSFAAACLLLCVAGAHADGDGASRTTLRAMIGCGAWSPSLQRCVRVSTPTARAVTIQVPDAGPDARPDHAGIRRDTYYFLGLQMSVIGVLYFMPESVSGWSGEQKDQHHVSKWWHNVSHPKWDSDDDYINYVLHPYWGATYYVRARERGYGQRGAFWYSFLLSTLYEAGAEALFEPVSVQDFFVTPIVGSWMGGHFMRWRNGVRERAAANGRLRFRDKALLVATDPLGNAADFIDRRLGRHVDVSASPFVTTMPVRTPDAFDARLPRQRRPAYGITLHLRW